MNMMNDYQMKYLKETGKRHSDEDCYGQLYSNDYVEWLEAKYKEMPRKIYNVLVGEWENSNDPGNIHCDGFLDAMRIVNKILGDPRETEG